MNNVFDNYIEDEYIDIRKLPPNERIKKIRTDREISQSELAKSLGVKITQQKISEIENGTQKIDTDTLLAYSKLYDVSSDYILGISEVVTVKENIRTCVQTTGLSEELLTSLMNDYKTVKENKGELSHLYFLYLQYLNYLLHWGMEHKEDIMKYERITNEVFQLYDNLLKFQDIDLIYKIDKHIKFVDDLRSNLVLEINNYFNNDDFNECCKEINVFSQSAAYKKINTLEKRVKELEAQLKEVNNDV